MGNRAVITTKNKDIGVYLHWNGGYDSVSAFLKYCELRGFRCPENDNYGWARMCQVIANYFGEDGLSIGIDRFECLEHSADYDNGVYVIENWKIVGRKQFDGDEQMLHDFKSMLHAINDAQVKEHRLPKEVIDNL